MIERTQGVLNTGSAPGMEQTRLSNGIRVLTEGMPSVRSAAVGIWIRQGSAHEPREVEGASHLLEHLVFKGTEERTAREIAREIEGIGGSLDAYTGREHTCYQARVLDEYVPLALEVLADLILSPLLRSEDLDLEREVVLEEIATVEDTPDDLVFEIHGERLWAGHPYGHSILGTRESVAAMTVEMLHELHHARYRSGDLVVAAAGSVDHDRIVELVEDLLGHLPGQGEHFQLPEPGETGSGDVRVGRETAQTHVVVGTDIPGHPDSRRYPLLLLNTAFGGGMSSRLFQRVREELALAYAVYSFQSFYHHAGCAGVYVGTRPGWDDRAVDVIREEYESLARNGLSAEEIEQTKRQVKGQIMLSLESPEARLYRLAGFALHDEPYLSLDELLARVDEVTGDEVAAVAGEFFAPERQLVVRLGP